LVRGGMLKSYTTQISHSTLFNKPTSVWTAVTIFICFFTTATTLWWSRRAVSITCNKMSICYFV
jgi:hypothetical protein